MSLGWDRSESALVAIMRRMAHWPPIFTTAHPIRPESHRQQLHLVHLRAEHQLTQCLPVSSASASQECVTAYNELKLNKKYKYIIYKLNDKHTEIVIENASTEGDWEVFRNQLINATTKTRTVRASPAIYSPDS